MSSFGSDEPQKEPTNQNDEEQSEQSVHHNKFSESSEKSVLLSIERGAYSRAENQRNIRSKDYHLPPPKISLQELDNKALNLKGFLSGVRQTIELERKISIKNEEIINLNSRLEQSYSENQALEEKIEKNETTLKIMADEYNKSQNKIVELEFSIKQMHEEGNAFKMKNNELSEKLVASSLKIDEITIENKQLREKIESLSSYSSQILKENNQINSEAANMLNFKRKVDLIKENLIEEISTLSEEKFKIFLDQNDFIRLMKLLIRERTNFLQEIKEKTVASEQINKLAKCLEIQTRENRVLIEEIASHKKILENLKKKNSELEERLFKMNTDLEEKKARDLLISSIIQDHTQIKMDMERKDKIVSEILLLASFYEQIRLAYLGKTNAQPDTNLHDVQNLLAYSTFREDLKTIHENTKKSYPSFVSKILELLPEKNMVIENSTQSDQVLSLSKSTQVSKEDGMIPYEQIQKENEKIKHKMEELEISFGEKLSFKVGKLKQYVEQLFGWTLLASNELIKLVNLKHGLELFFLIDENEITLINEKEILEILGNPPLNTTSEILAHFMLI